MVLSSKALIPLATRLMVAVELRMPDGTPVGVLGASGAPVDVTATLVERDFYECEATTEDGKVFLLMVAKGVP